jgi:hypothetical protein
MKQLFTFLITLLSISFGFTQQSTLEDFESSPSILGFEGLGSASIVVDPVTGGTNGDTFKLVTDSGGNGWQGAQVDLASGNYADLTSDKTMKIDVYSTTAFSLMAKVEDKVNNPAAPVAANTQAHNGTGWETLTFTFTTGSDNTATANGTYTRVAFFPNRNSGDNGWNSPVAAVTMHADNIKAVKYVATGPTCSDGIKNGDETGIDCGGTSCSPCPVPPTNSPTAPTRAAADVISIYSDAYTDIVASSSDYNPNWGQAGSVNTTYDPGDGNNLLLYSSFNYQGTNVTPTDVSSMENLHIDIWVEANVRTIKVTPILTGGTTTEFLVAVPVTAGSWNSVDIPLTNFTGLDFSNTVKELKFDGQFKTDGVTADTAVRSDVYLDNIYFWKSTTASVNDTKSSFSIYPNPINDIIEIRAAQAVHHVRIHDLTGKEVLRAAPNKRTLP